MDKHALLLSQTVSHAVTNTTDTRTERRAQAHNNKRTQPSFHTLFPSCEVREVQSVNVRKTDESVFQHVNTRTDTHTHTYTQSHTHSHIKISGSTRCNKRSSTCSHARPAVFTNTVENLRLFAFIFPKPSPSKGRQRPRLCLSAAEVPFSAAFNPHPLWGISHRAVDLFRIVFSVRMNG